jgi:hypothetical protein
MRFVCWITKPTNIRSEYLIRITLAQQQWLRERASILRYTRVASLVSALVILLLRCPIDITSIFGSLINFSTVFVTLEYSKAVLLNGWCADHVVSYHYPFMSVLPQLTKVVLQIAAFCVLRFACPRN